MSAWQRRKLTHGTRSRRYHAHSYYDIPVFDDDSRFIAAHETYFSERDPAPEDEIAVGIVDCDSDDGFQPLGRTTAWSWQQGPMAQWRPGSRILHWNDRADGQFITRLYDLDRGFLAPLSRPSYAISPDGRFLLSLNMARLDTLRPGYGYAIDDRAARTLSRMPADEGVWHVDPVTDESRLLLSLERAVACLHTALSPAEQHQHKKNRYHYWFNHAKIAPDGQRFTVKLRFKTLDGSWSDIQGVSLTCGVDGHDVRLLARATSHVIWKGSDRLFMWQQSGFYLYADDAPRGRRIRQIGAGLVEANAHLRYLPGTEDRFVFDTPYRDDIDLYVHDEVLEDTTWITRFSRHRPRNGPYRCDTHPCPSPDGRRIAVTSVEDGGRQLYLLERDDQTTETEARQ